jgi:hypothetical protein
MVNKPQIATLPCRDCGRTIEVIVGSRRKVCEECELIAEIRGGKLGGRPRKEKDYEDRPR